MARDMSDPRNLTHVEMVEWSRTAPVVDVLREIAFRLRRMDTGLAGNSISMYVDVLADRVDDKDR